MNKSYCIKTIIAFMVSIFSVPDVLAWGSMRHRTMLETSGSRYRETVNFHDGLGRHVQTAQTGLNTNGTPVASATDLNPDGSQSRLWLPFPVGGTAEPIGKDDIPSLSESFYSDTYAFSDITYDAIGRETHAGTAGTAWHEASKGMSTVYSTNKNNSVRLYRADVGGSVLCDLGFWTEGQLQSVKRTDEDGIWMEEFKDAAGHTVLERRGDCSDTYYVYNNIGQLRFVLQPMYEEEPDTDLHSFEYRYDSYGNISYKAVPGGGHTQYWHDKGHRVTFMQDPNLRARGLHRFIVYDSLGRPALQGVAESCTPSADINCARYTGAKSGFMQTGYTLQSSSGIGRATLEVVNYYDGHAFVDILDSRLANPTAISQKGKLTGTVVYDSDGGRSMTARYHDIRGNITTTREITNFGTLRVTENTYTFTNQPLASTMTEERITILTENSYDSRSGLLTHTDVTVNGVKQRVAKFTYDDLGRVVSNTRGNTSNGKVSYSYNLHGRTTSIKGPGFTQELHYADGPGQKLYNGSVSSMSWTMGSDPTVRGYRYSYNDIGGLTSARYGEGSSLNSRKDRYSEKSNAFNLNGSVTQLQRHGLMASGTYGKVDDLTITYNGNRVSSVSDVAPAVTKNGSMDYPGESSPMSFSYNESGSLTKDESRKIASIEYDNFGNPVEINFSDGRRIKNVYSPNGERLKTVNYTTALIQPNPPIIVTPAIGTLSETSPVMPPEYGLAGQSSAEYHGPVVYRNGKAYMALFAGGYASLDDGGVTFHYYTQDYLGNNRAVVNGTTGEIEQTVAYYPYGGVIADLGTGLNRQQYKFGGKELMTANGLNEYDFGARRYYQAVPSFTSIDPMCEKYPWLSPYLYCGNNPVNCIDPDGEDIVVLNYTEGQHLAIWIQNEKRKWQYYSINGNNVYFSGKHSGGRPFNDVAVGEWDSPEEFLNSSYNVRNDNSKEDKTMNHFGFTEGFLIPSSPEQDTTMRESFTKTAKTEYQLLYNNCATAVQKAMVDAGIPVSKPTMETVTIPMPTPGGLVNVFNGYRMKCDINIMPSSAFKSIMKWNPKGKYIKKL